MKGWEEGMFPPDATFPAGYHFGDNNVFGKRAKFGAGDTFGNNNVFGKGSVFGAGVSIGAYMCICILTCMYNQRLCMNIYVR